MNSKFLLSMMAIAMVFGFGACSFSSKNTDNVEEPAATVNETRPGFYQHDNFTLTYPEDWETQENVYGTLVAVLSPVDGEDDIFAENCNVVLDDSAEASVYSAKDYFDASVGQLASFITEYNEISRGDFKMDDQDVYYIAYNGLQGEYTLSWIQYLTKGEKNHYILTCTAMSDSFEAYRPTFDKIAGEMTVK